MSDLYELPNGWEWKTLSDVFTIERGGSPRPIKDYITEDEDGINWIKIGDTEKGGKYITSTAQKIKPSGLKKSRLVIDGDFIMSNSMSFGRPYIVKTKGAIHDGWLLMRDKLENMDKDFFYYLLSSNYMYQQFTLKASGTTVKNLNIDLVKSTNIPLPPLSEQQRIVSKLDKLFEKIDKSIALHQKNMDEADLFMGSVLNDVFGELEEKYPIKTLNDVFLIERGGSPRPIKEYLTNDENGINWIKIGDATKGDGKYIESTEQKIKESGLKKSRLVIEGDFIMSNSMSFGKPYIVKTKGAIHDGWLLMRDKLEDVDKEFFYYLLSSNYMYQQFISKASGTTVKNLNIDLVKSSNVILPPLHIQQKVVKYLDEISQNLEKVKSVQKEKMDSLKALKASILDKAFRGEL
jgi:type I restriction enzyme S subunit